MNAAERFFYEGEPTFSPTTGAGLSKDVWAKIDGLEKRQDLNGSRVRCVKYSASKERWIVKRDGSSLLVRPANLRAALPPQELVSAALKSDWSRPIVFGSLLPKDLAAAAGACVSFRDQASLTATANGWERLPLARERTFGDGWSPPTVRGRPYGRNDGEISSPLGVVAMTGSAVGSRGPCFVVASGGLVKVVAAEGDGPAPFEVGLDLMSGETGEGLPRPVVFCDDVHHVGASADLASIFVVCPPDDGLQRLALVGSEWKVVDESGEGWNSQFCAVGGNLVYHVHCGGEDGEVECSVHTAESLRRELPKITNFGACFSRGIPANIAANGQYLVATDARKSRVWRWEIAVAWRAGIATSFSQTRLAALTDGFDGAPYGIALSADASRTAGLMYVGFVQAHCVRIYGRLGEVLLQTIAMPGCCPIALGVDDERLCVGDAREMPPGMDQWGFTNYSRSHRQKLHFLKLRAVRAPEPSEPPTPEV